MTSSANIQKNTLEVKVELLDPPLTVGPEMLATATFLSPQNDGSRETLSPAERMFVPASLVHRKGASRLSGWPMKLKGSNRDLSKLASKARTT